MGSRSYWQLSTAHGRPHDGVAWGVRFRGPTLLTFTTVACVVSACGDDASGGDTEPFELTTGGPASSTSATGDDDPSVGPAGPTGPGDDSGTGSGPTDDSGTDDSTGGPPAEPGVQWVGRYDEPAPGTRRFGWSGAGFLVHFSGTDASVTMDDAAGFFTVVIDGNVNAAPLVTSGGEQTYILAGGLSAGEHTIEMYRRTEGSFGPTRIVSVDIEGELLPPPTVSRRMEVIGDSITAGYGNEGTDPCNFSADTENHYMTYGAIAARTVGAQLQTVAWSGKGLVNNFGDDTVEPLPEIYDRTVASDASSTWDYSWQADVVVLNIGTNDFSTDGDPPQNVFVPAYVDFLSHLRDVYPGAYLLAISPSLFGAEATMVDGYLTDAVAQRNAAGDADVGFANINVEWIGVGCDGHPTIATHEAMAANLAAELQTRLGW